MTGGYHKLVFAAGLVCLLAACGFHLRGEYRLAERLLPVQLAADGTQELRDELLSQFRANAIALADDSASAASALVIEQVRRSRRVVSVDSRGRAREYEIEYTVNWRYRYDGDASIERRLELRRDLLFDPDSVLALNAEIEVLYLDMQRDAARMIMQQLQSVQ